MKDIAKIVDNIDSDRSRWYKVNWVIVHTSHLICTRRGKIGHIRRQIIRRRLWGMAQRNHKVLRKYVIPREISGNTAPNIKPISAPTLLSRPSRRSWRDYIPIIIAAVIIVILVILSPVIFSSIGLMATGQYIGGSPQISSKYHVGEIATDQYGKQGYAIISDDGKGHYTVLAVFLDNSKKGWHTQGVTDSITLTYQYVEQRYPVVWSGGRMDITHIPNQDPTL